MKNKTAVILLLIANAVSGFAQGISMLAIPWYFADILGDASLFAKIYALITFLTLFWSLYAGSIIDRFSRKNVFLGTNIIGGIILTISASIGYYHGSVPYYLAGLVFGTTVFIYNIHFPNMYAFAQELTTVKNYSKINSFLEIQGQATSVIAGAFGAFILSGTQSGKINIMGANFSLAFDIEKWELQDVFLLDAVTYLISTILILTIKYQPTVQNKIQIGNVLERIKTGFAFLRKRPEIFIFGNSSFAVFLVLLIEIQLLRPVYVSNHLISGADIYASSKIYYALGALMAGVFTRQIFKNINNVLSVIILMLVSIVAFLACYYYQNIFVFFCFAIAIGVANSGTRILRVTYLFNKVPNEVFGRTSSVFQMINIGLRGVLIAIFSIPFFSEGNNVVFSYLICAFVVFVFLIPLIINYQKLK